MEEEILNYFNNTANGKFIRALDNNYKKYYTGVTLRYITYKVLKAKYKKSEVAECLLNLHKTSQIKGLFCSDIKQYVLEPLLSKSWNEWPCPILDSSVLMEELNPPP